MHERAFRYFLAVVRSGSIRGAAEALNVAASAVSRQIAEMEAVYRTPLLERLPRGVVPTEAGRVVAEHAQRQADEAAVLTDRLQRLRGTRQGTVRLACGAGFLADLVGNGLAGFSHQHPGVSYQVSLGTSDGILEAVAESEADIGLAYNPPVHAAVRAAVVARQPLVAVLPPSHPLARAPRPIGLRHFAGEPLALLPPDHGVRQLLGRVEADGGFRLNALLETGSFEMQRNFVAAGMGAAFLPPFAITAEAAAGQVVLAPLEDPLLAQASAHLLVRAGRRLPEAVSALLAWLAEHLVAFRPQP